MKKLFIKITRTIYEDISMTVNNDAAVNLYQNFNNWTNKHSENGLKTQQNYEVIDNSLTKIQNGMTTVQNSTTLTDGQKQDFYDKAGSLLKQTENLQIKAELAHALKEKEIGLTFDFMDGKDYTNEEDYNNQLGLIAQGDILAKDTDGNETVNFTEFLEQELSGIGEDDPSYEEAMTKVQEIFNSIDSDGSGEIDLEEMKFFYAFQDEADGQKDGKITNEPTFEEVSVEVDAWNSKEKNNIDCPSRLINNIFGVSLYTKQGQEYFQYLQDLNPDLDLNKLHPGMKIKLA